jgi:hypothetical protein
MSLTNRTSASALNNKQPADQNRSLSSSASSRVASDRTFAQIPWLYRIINRSMGNSAEIACGKYSTNEKQNLQVALSEAMPYFLPGK